MRSLPASPVVPASSGPAAPPAALEEAARVLEVLSPRERRHVLRDEAAYLLDGLLVRVARGRGSLDVALCEGLGALAEGDRLLRLGWSGVGDYARERLGVAARTGQVMARLGRALLTRPLLRAAVRSGEVSLRAAQEVAAVAVDEEEAAWVERARTLTVRGLVAAVREAQRGDQGDAAVAEPAGEGAEEGREPDDSPGGPEGVGTCAGPEGAAAGAGGAACAGQAVDGADVDLEAEGRAGGEGEPWQRVRLEVTPAAGEALESALDLAGCVLGPSAPRWQRLEAVAQEYLGAHGGDEPDEEVVAATLARWRGVSLEDRAGGGRTSAEMKVTTAGAEEAVEAAASAGAPGWQAELEAWLEAEHERWAFLERVEPVAAPTLELEVHPARLDSALRELAALRERWGSLLGHLALLVRMLGLWRDMRFVSFSHYCKERLGLSVRSVEQRVALERRMYSLPALRAALAEGRLDAERARLVAGIADRETEAAWIARAEGSTAVALRREVEAEEAAEPVRRAEAAQVCAPGGSPASPPVELRLRVPVRVAALLASALRVAQRAPRPDGRVGWRSDSECLALVAGHFLTTWAGLPRPRTTPQRRALARDGHRCQVPGCSRAAVHAHHVLYRSHGGGHQGENLTSLCAAHHLHGVHRGFVRVRGLAPDQLVWELGERGAFQPHTGPHLTPRLGREEPRARE